jgi:integrase-like protein
MKRRNPPHVHEYQNQHGTTVYYLRKPGHPKVRLRIPDGVLPWSPTFMAVYEAALAEVPPAPTIGAKRTVPGTVNAALISYYQSSAYKGLAASTQMNRRAILESFRNDHGGKRVALMHTQALQAILSAKRAVAQRNWRKALRGLVDHCLVLGMMKVDPLAAVKLARMKKSKGFHTWTEDEIATYRERHVPGTKARLALELILQTGHARADAVRMGRQHVKRGKLSMQREKTKVPFDIELLPELIAELALHKVEHLTFLVNDRGQPFTPDAFGDWFADRCKEAGVPGRAHGLRKAAAVRHALNGATAPELMAWFGWKTITEAQRYIEEASRIRLAESAGAKMRTGVGSPISPASQKEEKPL